MHESQFPTFSFSFSRMFDNMHRDRQPVSLMEGSFWLLLARFNLITKLGKLDFMCQQN